MVRATAWVSSHFSGSDHMLRKLFAVALVSLLAYPALTLAQFKPGDVELTLNGSGTNSKDFESGSFNVGAGLGYFLTNNFEIAVRQTVAWAHVTDSDTAFRTSGAIDFHFDFDRFQPFIGANIGYIYGDAPEETGVAGAEGGIKYFLNSTTFIYASIDYDFSIKEGFDEAAFFYALGLGVKL
jgi:hypothetical protein